MATTDEALAAVKTEREYQDSRWTDSDTSIAKFVVILQAYTNMLVHSHVGRDSYNDDTAALEQLRKIAAIAVRAMELNGVVNRV